MLKNFESDVDVPGQKVKILFFAPLIEVFGAVEKSLDGLWSVFSLNWYKRGARVSSQLATWYC